MKNGILLKNGRIITGSKQISGDVLIQGEKIKAIGKDLESMIESKDYQVIDVENAYIFPGAIDAHTHFSLPMADTISNDDFYNGSLAGLKGGVTSFIDFAGSLEGSLISGVKARLAESKTAASDYSFHLTVTGKDFEDFIENYEEIVDEFGLTSVKLFMAYKSRGLYSDDYKILKILEKARDIGGAMVCVHAENADIIEGRTAMLQNHGETDMRYFSKSRPVITEIEAVSRFMRLVEFSGSKGYVMHLTSGEASIIIEKARERGVDIGSETSMNYLLLDSSLYLQEDGHYYTTCPPLRSSWDNDILWSQLGISILSSSTDHCSFNKAQKDTWEEDFSKLPFGLGAIEINVPLLFSEGVVKGRISLETFVKLVSENPARNFNLFPEKGSLMPGSDADIFILDPAESWTLRSEDFQMKTDINPFEGKEIQGRIKYTISRGEIVFDHGKLVGSKNKGRGKFIKRKLT